MSKIIKDIYPFSKNQQDQWCMVNIAKKLYQKQHDKLKIMLPLEALQPW
jgi:hypothetical protein